MIIAIAITSIAIFLAALHLSGVIKIGTSVLPIARSALETIRNPTLSIDQKEHAVQQASLSLARAFGSILIRTALTVAVSLIPLAGAELLGWATIDQVTAFLSRWDVILIATAVIVAGYVLGLKLWPST